MIGLRGARKVGSRQKAVGSRQRGEETAQFTVETLARLFRDRMVENAVLLELKAARALDSSHEAQLLNYLRATEIEVGLLFNFGIKPEFKRLAFDNERKRIAAD